MTYMTRFNTTHYNSEKKRAAIMEYMKAVNTDIIEKFNDP